MELLFQGNKRKLISLINNNSGVLCVAIHFDFTAASRAPLTHTSAAKIIWFNSAAFAVNADDAYVHESDIIEKRARESVINSFDR